MTEKGLRGRRIVPPLFASICTHQEDLVCFPQEEIRFRTAVRPFRAAPGSCRAKRSCATTLFIDLTLSSSQGLTRARIFTDGMSHETETSMYWLVHRTLTASGLEPPVPSCWTSNTDLYAIFINGLYIAQGLCSHAAHAYSGSCPTFALYLKPSIPRSVCKRS